MTQPGSTGITDLLHAHGAGDPAALEELLPLVYGELRRIARGRLRRERPGHTLAPTELVHEAFLKLVPLERVDWRGRAQSVWTGAGARISSPSHRARCGTC
jgi:hypothetical protein